jgi:hypothetical protein
LGRLEDGRKFGFDLERDAFAMTMQRLMTPGSDLQGSGGQRRSRDYRSSPCSTCTGPLASWPRAGKSSEKTLFARGRDLFVVVADRGMMGKKSLDLLTDGKAPYDYILGCHSGGAKNLIGNKGYVPYLRVAKDAVQIDEGKGLLKSRFDDKYVLRANTDHPAAEVAKSYKNIWRVDRAFREAKSTIQVRPVFHHRVDTTIGHFVAGFLALQIEVDLQRRLDEHKIDVSWPTLMRDLSQDQAVQADGRSCRLRSDLQVAAYQAFQAAGVRPPSAVAHVTKRMVCSAKVQSRVRNPFNYRELGKQTVEDESKSVCAKRGMKDFCAC